MPLQPKYFALISTAMWVAVTVAVAPHAAADEPMPAVGQSPIDAIDELDAAGYLVAVNWTRGYSDVPLSECTLLGVHNPDGSGPPSNTTVYLDISCPPDDTD